ncbi:RNA polymerase sigma factor [Primorskyibacter sp. S187A]|uniref:RNA polymerase sigma factor n=1 Tax=Primorskyibacter sp. S187A TaxID=3415130 RepID=UPI003C7C4C6D
MSPMRIETLKASLLAVGILAGCSAELFYTPTELRGVWALEEHDLTVSDSNTAETADPCLPLLFVCAHPGIAEPGRGPLMLQAVLGFTAAEIARAYVSSPAAIPKQLVRAKERIKANAIPFRVPDPEIRAERLSDVMEAIYGCYALCWLDGQEADSMQREAVYLSDLLASEMNDDPEVLGLSALLAFLHSRRAARLRDGCFVPLAEQPTEIWDHELVAAADLRLRQAFQLARPGRFRMEVAIQSVHAARARTGTTDWPALLSLYEGLIHFAPTLGAYVSQAAVVGEINGPEAGLSALEKRADPRLERFQPYWATRAHLLAGSGAIVEARDAYDRAISLAVSAGAKGGLATARAKLDQP